MFTNLTKNLLVLFVCFTLSCSSSEEALPEVDVLPYEEYSLTLEASLKEIKVAMKSGEVDFYEAGKKVYNDEEQLVFINAYHSINGKNDMRFTPESSGDPLVDTEMNIMINACSSSLSAEEALEYLNDRKQYILNSKNLQVSQKEALIGYAITYEAVVKFINDLYLENPTDARTTDWWDDNAKCVMGVAGRAITVGGSMAIGGSFVGGTGCTVVLPFVGTVACGVVGAVVGGVVGAIGGGLDGAADYCY
jgi:hypothetical protein